MNVITDTPAVTVVKKAKVTGRYHWGYKYHPGLLKGVTYIPVLIPEIYIQQGDGKNELLYLEGIDSPDDLDITVMNGLAIKLGLPSTDKLEDKR